jgi:hypothetical protein
MSKSLLLLFWFVCSSASAQMITVSATVVDRESREPLVFATVGIKHKSIGTISNLQGEFDFHFSSSYARDTLTISILGYALFEAPVQTLIGRTDLVIEMQRTTVMLNEVVVIDSLRAGEILQIALERIETNYAEEPYMMDGFYRDIKKVGGTYISLLEAATKIYDDGYKPPRNRLKLRERVALIEVRRSIGYRNKFTGFFDQDNMLGDLLLQNTVKYRHFPSESIFFEALVREKDTRHGEHDTFVLSISDEYTLKVFVDKETFAIIHLEYDGPFNDVVDKRKGMYGRLVRVRKTIDFRPVDGKFYLNFITADTQVNWYDLRSDDLRFETELHQELLINAIEASTADRIGRTEKMRSYGLQYQDLPYNKEFWDNYNVIKESPLDKKIVEDLEKLGPLEKQFEDYEGLH